MLVDKDAVVSAIQSALDAVNALPAVSPDGADQLAALQAQVDDLQKKNSDAQAALDAEVAKEADDAAQLSAAKSKIDAAKAALA